MELLPIHDPERIKYVQKQFEYCKARDIEVLLPSSGFCYKCHADLADHFQDHMSKQYILGCPYCGCLYTHECFINIEKLSAL